MFKPQHASACFRVVVSVSPGFHGAIHDTEEDYQMPSVTECNASRNGTYYIDDEVADLLGISLGRLRNKLCAGNPLPPRIEPPGCRHRLWPCQGVHEWLEQFTVSVVDRLESGNQPRPRGRLTKQEERSRRR
jgi:hypothetical protein